MNKQKEKLFPVPIRNVLSEKSKEIFVLGENINLDLINNSQRNTLYFLH